MTSWSLYDSVILISSSIEIQARLHRQNVSSISRRLSEGNLWKWTSSKHRNITSVRLPKSFYSFFQYELAQRYRKLLTNDRQVTLYESSKIFEGWNFCKATTTTRSISLLTSGLERGDSIADWEPSRPIATLPLYVHMHRVSIYQHHRHSSIICSIYAPTRTIHRVIHRVIH